MDLRFSPSTLSSVVTSVLNWLLYVSMTGQIYLLLEAVTGLKFSLSVEEEERKKIFLQG